MPPLDASPSHYVARIDRATGRELPGPIRPEELLVHPHRDRHPLDLAVQVLASRLVTATGSEWIAKQGLRGLNRLGRRLGAALGVSGRDELFRFRSPFSLTETEARAHVEALRREARMALRAGGASPGLRLFLTGATGFLGKELSRQAALAPRIEEVVCLVRTLRNRDPRSKRLVVAGPRQRGAALLHELGISKPARRKFRFVAGDVEKPGLGLGSREARRLETSITHVVHCAASVAFDDPYERSFRANVVGARNALALSLRLQHAAASPFVAHLAIETSYAHGRHRRDVAGEDRLEFPRHYYNNYYELTKAMASLETERAMLERGLRVAQLLPSIVIGNSRTGNNHGDTKVVNAPINAFGRIKVALDRLRPRGWRDRLRAALVDAIGRSFPADPSAELNLVPVDRVAGGILAALETPEAVGTRIHLVTDRRIRSADMAQLVREELGVKVRMADPTLARVVTMPLVKAALERLGEDKLARALGRLSAVFGAYSEWGQPVHGVGKDVAVLGLPRHRPDTAQAFRMLCRHNRFVQEFGRVQDSSEIARRERIWEEAIDALEFEIGRPAASLPPPAFERLISRRIDFQGFRRRVA